MCQQSSPRGRSMFAHKPHTDVRELHEVCSEFSRNSHNFKKSYTKYTSKQSHINTQPSPFMQRQQDQECLTADRFVCFSLFPLALLVRFAVWLWRRAARKASELSLWPQRESCQGFEMPLHKYTSHPESSGLHLPLTTQTCRRCWQENRSPSLRWSGYDTRQAFLMQCCSTLWGKVCLMPSFVQLKGIYTSTLPQYLGAGEELR